MDMVLDRIRQHMARKVGVPMLDGAEGLGSISKENFKEVIPRISELGYVDGGSQAVFDTPDLALFLIRAAAITNKTTRKEFFSLLSVDEKGMYRAESFGHQLDYVIDPMHRSIATSSRPGLPVLSNIVRRFAELEMASGKGMVVLDGTLEPKYPGEEGLLRQLLNGRVCAVAKTNNLLTDNGTALAPRLDSLSPFTSWYYPLATREEVKIYLAKFHARSRYVFRVETNIEPQIIMPALAHDSRDPVFIGYPYGLVKADKIARVSEEEIGILKVQLMVKLGKGFGALQQAMNSLNAHEVLDTI